MKWRSTSVLGLGFSSDFGHGLPPLARYCVGKQHVDYLNIAAHATQLSKLKYYMPTAAGAAFPNVFHTLNFNTATDDVDNVAMLMRTKKILAFLRPKWMASDIAIWVLDSGVYLDALMLPPILDRATAYRVGVKAKQLEEYFGLPFFLENPPFAAAPGAMHILTFMSETARIGGCGLVLDIGHLRIFQAIRGKSLQDIADRDIPYDLIAEIHLAGLQEVRTADGVRLLDRHDLPIREDCWDFLEEHLPKLAFLKGITLEQEGCESELVRHHIARARQILFRSRPASWR